MALMLQIVKHRYRGNAREHRRCKARIEENVDAILRRPPRQDELFVCETQGTERGSHMAAYRLEMRRSRNQPVVGLAVDID